MDCWFRLRVDRSGKEPGSIEEAILIKRDNCYSLQSVTRHNEAFVCVWNRLAWIKYQVRDYWRCFFLLYSEREMEAKWKRNEGEMEEKWKRNDGMVCLAMARRVLLAGSLVDCLHLHNWMMLPRWILKRVHRWRWLRPRCSIIAPCPLPGHSPPISGLLLRDSFCDILEGFFEGCFGDYLGIFSGII